MEFTGAIERIGATVTVSDKFKKRDFVISDDPVQANKDARGKYFNEPSYTFEL